MLLYAPVVSQTDETENLRVRVTPRVKEGLEQFAERKKTTQQATVNGVLAWFFEQDSRLQSLIVGQIEPEFHAEIIDKVLSGLRNASVHAPPSRIIPAESQPRTPGRLHGRPNRGGGA